MATTCDINGKKPIIDYPCEWKYKLILEKADAKAIAKEVLGKKEFKCESSRDSKGGKYTSYNLTTLVINENERLAIFEALKAHKDTKFVL